MTVSLRIPPALMDELQAHLFPGDHVEHGAVISASVLETSRGVRLIAHKLFLAEDGVDYIPGKYGYRMLTASFVRHCVLECAGEDMAYLAVHCHGGTDSVAFSSTDMASHERGYPALLDILDGRPAGGLVFARNAVAGDIWFPGDQRQELDVLVVPGRPIRSLYDSTRLLSGQQQVDGRFDRQARLFGDRGQAILQGQKVGVIGAGGAGSLVIEYLARLGVGELVVIDPDRIDPTNLSRVVGSCRWDARPWLTHRLVPRSLRELFENLRTPKVSIAERIVKQASHNTSFAGHRQDVTEDSAAAQLIDCDYLFLAADTMQARLVFNSIVHQYLIPGVQMGVKAQIETDSGAVVDLFAVVRPVVPGGGCLWCNELISPAKLQEEATASDQRKRQRYVDDEDVPSPSVITMNAIAASQATNDFLMSVTGLLDKHDLEWIRISPRELEFTVQSPRRDDRCGECSEVGRLGRGPTRNLPTKHR